MAKGMPLLWIALGIVFVDCLVWAMTAISPGSQWQTIAIQITAYSIVITIMGGAFFVLFQYIGRR